MTPNDQQTMIGAAEIAALLGWTTSWFRKQVQKLVQEEGMPAPMPGRYGRWHRARLMAWIENYGAMKAKANRASLATIKIQWDRDALTEKYARSTAA